MSSSYIKLVCPFFSEIGQTRHKIIERNSTVVGRLRSYRCDLLERWDEPLTVVSYICDQCRTMDRIFLARRSVREDEPPSKVMRHRRNSRDKETCATWCIYETYVTLLQIITIQIMNSVSMRELREFGGYFWQLKIQNEWFAKANKTFKNDNTYFYFISSFHLPLIHNTTLLSVFTTNFYNVLFYSNREIVIC